MNRPVHFEILADNPEKVGDFYKKVLGWKVESWGGGGDLRGKDGRKRIG